MFIQIIQAPAGDAGALRRQVQRWATDLRPGADGFLGSTAGVSGAGDFLLVARFDGEEAARRNSERPEQGEWWAEMQRALAGEATFSETTDISMHSPGSDEAGFVQMMQARVTDRARWEQIEEEIGPEFIRLRPDVLGAVRLWLPGPRVHVVDYFTSEAEARAGESVEMPARVQELFGDWMGLLKDVRWHDIQEPWLTGPA